MWRPTFRSGEASFGSTLVWARIEGLPIGYYNKTLITKIASVIGIPFKVDLTTKSQKVVDVRLVNICAPPVQPVPVAVADGLSMDEAATKNTPVFEFGNASVTDLGNQKIECQGEETVHDVNGKDTLHEPEGD
ncbi:hypothetical protein PIB30_056974 [Stylosanthes scabra]|uniref:DUF4283 domain-containing protein n=1 Tax=Stylosanthes scabra TaxID=79078 RepID=A0ABU6QJG0_9FABA|nr:hypothetical protein [Stylosanthes scabra]